MSDKLRVITTEDGSSSIYHEGLRETYHSFHGAMRESVHVFIKAGLHHWLAQNSGEPVSILEVGMGTGLNVILTIKAQLEIGFPVHYTTLEPYPLPEKVLQAVNYKALLNHQVLSELFDRIHELPWEEEVSASLEFTLEKLQATLQAFDTRRTYNLVYFDAFAPNKQPELWEPQWLHKVYRLMKPGAVLTTYCAKGQFKRDLKAVGFEVESLPGPPGKMEMVRATRLAR